jgi:hypothetical protein
MQKDVSVQRSENRCRMGVNKHTLVVPRTVPAADTIYLSPTFPSDQWIPLPTKRERDRQSPSVMVCTTSKIAHYVCEMRSFPWRLQASE